jgi:hypothetical protein
MLQGCHTICELLRLGVPAATMDDVQKISTPLLSA